MDGLKQRWVRQWRARRIGDRFEGFVQFTMDLLAHRDSPKMLARAVPVFLLVFVAAFLLFFSPFSGTAGTSEPYTLASAQSDKGNEMTSGSIGEPVPLGSQHGEYLESVHHSHLEQSSNESSQIDEPVASRHVNRRFVLVIPATASDPELCKTVVTAIALGYPAPIILNWGVNVEDVTHWHGGHNLLKIPGFLRYVEAALQPDAHTSEKLNDDDLILLVDGYDMWFQLPPEVLLRRYHKINREANDRLEQLWRESPAGKSRGLTPVPVRQTILGGAGKSCYPPPHSGSNMYCDKLPVSPLREDLYGSKTGQNTTNRRDHRPRYINGGMYLGPAGDLRRLFRRALDKMEAGLDRGDHLFSEQGIPGEVFGEQEIWRNLQRNGGSDVEEGRGGVKAGDDAMSRLFNRDFEYGFGLDYGQQLSAQLMWTKHDNGLFDGAFVSLDNQTALNEYSTALGISPPRLHSSIVNEIRDVHNPLAQLTSNMKTKSFPTDWGSLSLYADFFLESIPVMVHYNADMEWKILRQVWWERPWFYRWLRKLLLWQVKLAASREDQPSLPIANVTDYIRNDGRLEQVEYSYWYLAAEQSDKRARKMEFEKKTIDQPLRQMDFRAVCRYSDEQDEDQRRQWWEEVFRDGQGPII